MYTSLRVLRNRHVTPIAPRPREMATLSLPISSLALPASFGLHTMSYHPGDPFWAGLGKPEARCLSRKTPDVPKVLQNQ